MACVRIHKDLDTSAPPHTNFLPPNHPFSLAPAPAANHMEPSVPDLLHLVSNTHWVLQAVNSDLGCDCWLCVPLSAISYRALGLTLNNSKLGSTTDPDNLL